MQDRSSTNPYSQQQSLGHAQVTPHWSFTPDFGMIFHPPELCVACGTFSGHYMNALISRDTSFLEARENCKHYYAQNMSNSYIHKLNATIDVLTRENTELKHQLAIASHPGKNYPSLSYQSLGPQKVQTLVVKGHRTAPYAG